MQPNRVKKIIREGGLALGTYVGGIADPQIVEIIGHAGFDAAFIDMEHITQSNREITLALMIEDQLALDQIEDIAKVEGVDLIVVGPSDMSRTLGVTGTPNHPKLLAVIERLQAALAAGAGAKLAQPINHPALPRDAGQLKAMGCAYANCAPSPEVRLMKSLQAQAVEMRKQLA